MLLNVGRANVISSGCLLRALDSGWLSGAVLDVFAEEPLPAGHPLWARRDVVLTPHLAGIARPGDIARCLAGNLDRARRGRLPANLADWQAQY